ncbi:MAG: TIGR00266 family protein [Phycisphaerales bacterium]|nr:TIGR00266 family protein [Phycisphaerales bacterium]
MPTDVIDYQIIGDDLQAVVITLDPDEAVVAEAGAMMYMEDGVEMATSLSMRDEGGLFGRLFKAGKRLITGESFFITVFANGANVRRDVAFASPYPGHVVPVELGDHGGTVICQKDAFLCGARGIDVDIAFQRRLGVGFFGGEGFILQRITAPDGDGGLTFLHAGGSVLRRALGPNETLRVDTGCIVGFETSVDYDIQFVKGIKNKLFGGEGLFYATLRGPGVVWLQTLPFSRLAGRIYAAAPQGGGKRQGEGSILGGIWDLVDGR